MGELEANMRALAAALTGKTADEIPDKLEDICSFVAEQYRAPAASPFRQVTAPAEATSAPTQEEYNGLIAQLKEAKVFK